MAREGKENEADAESNKRGDDRSSKRIGITIACKENCTDHGPDACSPHQESHTICPTVQNIFGEDRHKHRVWSAHQAQHSDESQQEANHWGMSGVTDAFTNKGQ